MKTLKISSDCHIKNARNLKYHFFRRTYALSVGFKMKPLKENAFSCAMVKTSSNNAVKVAERSNGSIFNCLVNHLAQTSILFNMSLIELYSLIELIEHILSTYEKCLT